MPVFIGIVLTVMVLGLIGYISKQRRDAATATPPQLEIVTPAANAVLDSPLVIRFTSSEPLRLRETGWGIRALHLHARVNSTEHTPAAADIQHTDSGYLWTLRSVGTGPVIIKLGWAGPDHRELSAGASSVDGVNVR